MTRSTPNFDQHLSSIFFLACCHLTRQIIVIEIWRVQELNTEPLGSELSLLTTGPPPAQLFNKVTRVKGKNYHTVRLVVGESLLLVFCRQLEEALLDGVRPRLPCLNKESLRLGLSLRGNRPPLVHEAAKEDKVQLEQTHPDWLHHDDDDDDVRMLGSK